MNILSELILLSDFFQLRLWLMTIVSMRSTLYELWATTMQIDLKSGNKKWRSHYRNIRSGVWDFDHQCACCACTRVLSDRAEDISIWFLEIWKEEWKIYCLNSAHKRFRILFQNYVGEDVLLIIIADFCVILVVGFRPTSNVAFSNIHREYPKKETSLSISSSSSALLCPLPLNILLLFLHFSSVFLLFPFSSHRQFFTRFFAYFLVNV